MSLQTTEIKTNISAPTYFIRTFGCQMNVADSLEYARVLEGLGCVRTDDESSADLIVINTCTIREKADEKAISYVGNVVKQRRSLAEASGYPLRGGIALVGCMATIRGDEVQHKWHDVKLVLPSSEQDQFESRVMETWPELVGSNAVIQTEPVLRPEEKFGRFINIVRGCANRCTYCIVPTSRGGELISRTKDTIFQEVENVINAGVKSVTFLGQNVSAYGDDIDSDYNLAKLLTNVSKEFENTGVWFKFLTSHPANVTDELIDTVASHPSLSKWIHMPVQAGDDEVLKRMDRGYTSAYYIELVDKMRDKIPDLRLTTDLIVGFPGESESAFENTIKLVEAVQFDSAFTFLYSVRRNTPASKWEDPVSKAEKKNRFDRLVELQNEISIGKAREQEGKIVDILVESEASSQDGNGILNVAGRTREEQMVILPGNETDFGKIVKCRITEGKMRILRAERI